MRFGVLSYHVMQCDISWHAVLWSHHQIWGRLRWDGMGRNVVVVMQCNCVRWLVARSWDVMRCGCVKWWNQRSCAMNYSEPILQQNPHCHQHATETQPAKTKTPVKTWLRWWPCAQLYSKILFWYVQLFFWNFCLRLRGNGCFAMEVKH